MCRAVYEWELARIQQLWEQGCAGDVHSPSAELRNQLNQRFLHVLQFFTFHDSTPSPKVADLLRNSFYACSSLPLMLLSSVGVRAAPDIRTFDPAFAFLKSLPMLSEHVAQKGHAAIKSLPDVQKIRHVEAWDVRTSLQKCTLDEEELVSCLRWWIGTLRAKDSMWTRTNLLDFATLVCRGSGKKLPLSSVKHFVDPTGLGAHIPHDSPLPESLLPLTIHWHLSYRDLASVGWQEFTVPDWLQYLSDPSVIRDPEYDFTQTIHWAERVLETLARVWSSLNQEARHYSREILISKPCIPTIHGLLRPDCSYLLSATDNPFDNLELAIVRFGSGPRTDQEMEILLAAIGVRRNVPPEVLRDR